MAPCPTTSVLAGRLPRTGLVVTPMRCALVSQCRVLRTHLRWMDCRRPKRSGCCIGLCGGRAPMLTDRCIWRIAREGLVLLPLLAACSSDPITLAPSTPETPWRIPPQSEGASPLAGGPAAAAVRVMGEVRQSSSTMTSSAANVVVAQRPSTVLADSAIVERNREYDLAALIDLAQRSNPQTREAWERARQAALAGGRVQRGDC